MRFASHARSNEGRAVIDLSLFTSFAGTTRDGSHVSLRLMRAGDEFVFRQLYAGTRAMELQAVPWTPAVKQEFCDQQYTLQDRHYRAHYAQFLPLAVCAGEEVIGRFYLGEFDDVLIAMDIIIAPQWRRHGIAALLFEIVTRHADACRIDTRLHVEPDNPARQLYARLGFTAVGEAGVYQEMLRRVFGAT